MADGLSGIGAAPFNVQSDIHQQTQSRERIETHLSEQRVDRFGRKTTADRPQGTKLNIEV